MGHCLGYWQALDGACLPCSLHGQIFNMAGFGMWERGFNTIISRMIVSHYSAVASSTGMREGCLLLQLWRGSLCWLLEFSLSFSPAIFSAWNDECWLIGVVWYTNWEIKRKCLCAHVQCLCVYKQHARVCVCLSVPVCWNTSWWRDALFMSLPVMTCGFSPSALNCTTLWTLETAVNTFCGFKLKLFDRL